LLDVTNPFAEVHGEMAGSVTVSLPTSPTLALRVGGKKLWGTVPINEAAFLGGSGSLRAFGRRSLAGDAAVYGSAELRLTAGEVTLFQRQLRYGFLGLTDIGRIFYDGVSSDGWLNDVGGGLWFAPLGGEEVFSVGVARGPLGSRLFFSVGLKPGQSHHP
jgi:outer membrane protein assembly factor BamA